MSLSSIDNKLSNIINTSTEVITELENQNNTINNISKQLLDINNYIYLSKKIYNNLGNILYNLDYYNLYDKYNNVIVEECIEMETFDDNINAYEDKYGEDDYDVILDKLDIIKNRSLYINKTLNNQTKNINKISIKTVDINQDMNNIIKK
jgi:hypothetical protein